ncbi:MAG TPA: nicotinate phosphoribosyltransferase [Acidobacteriota bacterium]|nr:nicotinate phosphoribosyltransferase [Acidobacteriota bacterium]
MTLRPLFPTVDTLGINTDLYELTMAAAYFEGGFSESRATFELFTRRLPRRRTFLLAAGLEQALHYITHVEFGPETIAYLRQLAPFKNVSDDFFDYLSNFRFTGDVYAMPEGTPFFENEPVLQVTAPVIEAQILETYLINTINVQTMVASKAARLCLAARGKSIVDFGSRRAHGPQTGVLAARAAYIGGAAGTSNVLAGFETGIPVYGTMAHSFVQFFDSEKEAFELFRRTFPNHSTILVDTYDTIEGVRKAISLEGPINAVRLDSGDLAALAVEVRKLLDSEGHKDVAIIASGSLDEEKILAFSLKDAPIDSYGVGTELVTSGDAPGCDLVYKLVETFKDGEAQPRFKASKDKATLPYRKQVFRRCRCGEFWEDVIGRCDEELDADEEVRPLLKQYIKDGQLITELPHITEIREYAKSQLDRLRPEYKNLHTAEVYPVSFSRLLLEALEALQSHYLPG